MNAAWLPCRLRIDFLAQGHCAALVVAPIQFSSLDARVLVRSEVPVNSDSPGREEERVMMTRS